MLQHPDPMNPELRQVDMRSMTVIAALLAILALGVVTSDAVADPDPAKAAGGCDPAACASTCKSATTEAKAQSVSADLPAPGGDVYGEGVAAGDTMPISKLLAQPEKHLGHTVRVQGPIVGVCKSRGCWIEIASDKEMQKIQLKVEDGEIVFPPEIMGQTAIVEGVLEGIPMTHEQACAFLEHEAECQGESFDRSTVPAEGITMYRIKGTGAVVLASAES
ncbi:DUF4920 domain-containing protein [bacterium]|nr:DUF4920 domain-containing protein [bacterium]